MHCDSIPHFSSAFRKDWWLIESNAFMKSNVVTGISVPAVCILQAGPAFGESVQILPGLLIALGRVRCPVCCI